MNLGAPQPPSAPDAESIYAIERPSTKLLWLYVLRVLALGLLGPWFWIALLPLYFRYIENAEEVRDRILQLLHAYRDAGLGDRDPHPHVSGGGLTMQALDRLREVRDETQGLRRALESA